MTGEYEDKLVLFHTKMPWRLLGREPHHSILKKKCGGLPTAATIKPSFQPLATGCAFCAAPLSFARCSSQFWLMGM